MGFYGGGWVQKMINIQEPTKFILKKMGLGTISPDDAKVLITLLKEISELPKLDKEKVRNPNTRILIETYEEAKRHLTKEFLDRYEPILDVAFNFAVSKIDYDGFYDDLALWFLGEILRRGFQLPNHNRPNTTLWDAIPPNTRARLAQSIKDNYDLLQDRLKVINEKLGDSAEGNIHRASRKEQFANRILVDVEREVVAWH